MTSRGSATLSSDLGRLCASRGDGSRRNRPLSWWPARMTTGSVPSLSLLWSRSGHALSLLLRPPTVVDGRRARPAGSHGRWQRTMRERSGSGSRRSRLRIALVLIVVAPAGTPSDQHDGTHASTEPANRRGAIEQCQLRSGHATIVGSSEDAARSSSSPPSMRGGGHRTRCGQTSRRRPRTLRSYSGAA